MLMIPACFVGWMIVLIGLLLLAFLWKSQVYRFLAVNAPIQAEVLVVEGWLPDYALKAAVTEFHRGKYQQVVTIGAPLYQGSFLFEYKTFADLSAATLVALGIEPEKVLPIPTPTADWRRTHTTALGLKHWLQTEATHIQSINIYSIGPHARRSWLLFRRALAPHVKVGILAATPKEYQPDRWWKYSSGARAVLSETIAYFYTYLPWSAP